MSNLGYIPFSSAVSKSLSFTEESLAITQVAEKDVVMDIITTQVKEDGMGSTVEIVVHYFNFLSEKYLTKNMCGGR